MLKLFVSYCMFGRQRGLNLKYAIICSFQACVERYFLSLWWNWFWIHDEFLNLMLYGFLWANLV